MKNTRLYYVSLIFIVCFNLTNISAVLGQITIDFGDAKNGIILPKNDSSLVVNDTLGRLFLNTTDSSLYMFDGRLWKEVISANVEARSLFIGKQSGENIDRSLYGYNTVLGDFAADKIIFGTENTMLGYQAGMDADTLFGSVLIGYQAGLKNAGQFNVFIGSESSTAHNNGSHNVGVGTSSMQDNTTGENNTAIGSTSLDGNTTGCDNVAVGHQSLHFHNTGNNNTAVGSYSLGANNFGEKNTAIGYEAGGSTPGSGSVFVGYKAGQNELSDNKLYIANDSSDFPLIFGDFKQGEVNIKKELAVGRKGSYSALHVKQNSNPSVAPPGNYINYMDGITLEDTNSYYWNVYIDNFQDLNFAAKDTLRSYIRDTDGAYVTQANVYNLQYVPTKKRSSSLQIIENLTTMNFKTVDSKKSMRTMSVNATSVKKHFPEAYTSSGDKEGIIYDQFALLSLDGIKELIIENQTLKKINSEQDQEIADLKKVFPQLLLRLEKLEKAEK